MATLVGLIRSYSALEEVNVPSSTLPEQISVGLTNKDWRLLDIVKELGEYLLSEVDGVRSRGITLLSAIVSQIDKKSLDRQSTKTLITFFVDKLSDPTALIPSCNALIGLTESPGFGTGEGMEVARGLFASVKLQSFPQSSRFLVYCLVDTLLLRSRPALKRLGKDFIAGYCALAEGEKDPRNLMLSFSIIKIVLLEFEIGAFVEDLFDITFCYFPITFTPPADDPYGITSDQLVVALRECLSATPKFGALALPLFLDKMQASSEKAKRQTLQAITACFPIYGAVVCGEWAGRFSEALSIEVFHATDNDTCELALGAFRSLFSTLYPDSSSATLPQVQEVTGGEEDVEMSLTTAVPTGSNEIHGIGIKVVKNSLDELKEPEKSNAVPAVKILASLIRCSNRLAHYCLSLALPQLLALFKNPDEVSLRAPVLSCLSTLLEALAPSASSSSATAPALVAHNDSTSPLEFFRDDLLSVFTSGSRSTTSRPPALDGLVNLIRIAGFLQPTEISYCVSAINDVLVSPDGEDQYESALDGLVIVSNLYSKTIEAETLPILFAALPSSAPSAGTKESEDYRRALSSLAALCIQPDLFEILSVRILAKLEGICSVAFSTTEEQNLNSLYAHHLLSTLRSVLRMKAEKGHEDLTKYVEKLVPRLIGLFVLPTTKIEVAKEVAKDIRLLEDVGKVVKIVLQRVDAGRQAEFFKSLHLAFVGGSLEPLLGEQSKYAGESGFQPLSTTSSIAQQDTIILFSAALLPLRPTVVSSASDITTFLHTLLERSLRSTSETQTTAALHLLSSTINKRAPDIPEFFASEAPLFYQTNIANSEASISTRKLALRAWAWIAKGLITRSEQRGYDAVDQIITLLHDPLLGREAAAALGIIGDEGDRVLSKENFAIIRLLFKQRFFTFLLPKLVDGHKSTVGGDQAVYLVALSCLLQHIPKAMSLTELPKLLPLLQTALDLPDAALRANVIETLGVLAKEVPKEMDNSISNIVVKVLRDSLADSNSGAASTKLRLASLTFLAVLPEHIPYMTLHPQKALVLAQLGKAVDDKKREVRKAAVDCRSRWFLYSG